MSGCVLSHRPVMLDAGGGEVLDALGMQVVVKVPAAASGGSVGIVEMLVPPGEGPPMHVHHREEEAIHVLEGRFRFWCGDRVWDGYEGATVLLPRGIPHTFQVGCGGATAACVFMEKEAARGAAPSRLQRSLPRQARPPQPTTPR